MPAKARRSMLHTLKNPIRIVLLLQDLEFGGTQRYAVNLLKHMDRDLFTPELWVLRGGMDMASQARDTGVKIRWFSEDIAWVPPGALIKLAQMLIQKRPHILYTLTVAPNIWGRLLGRMARVPLVVSSCRNPPPLKQYEGLLCPLSTLIIANSRYLGKFLMKRYGIRREGIEVIPNGVDTQWYRPAPEKKTPRPTILYAGRLVDRKDPLTLVKGFSLALKEIPGARLEIVGNGPLKEKLSTLIRQRGLSQNVFLIQGTRDILPHLQRAWIFAMTPTREASPNAILEAMSCALPVVATRVGGIPELVGNDRTGVLIRPESPEGLARALVDLMRNSPKGEMMGQKGRAFVLSNHSIEKTARISERVFLKACSNKIPSV